MENKIMLFFGLFLIIFSLNVIQCEVYESKPSELSKAATYVQEYLVSLDDLDKSNIKNNIIKKDVSGVEEQKYTSVFSFNVIQSKLYESESDELSEAASNVQENLVSLDDLDYSNIKNNIIKRDVSGVDEQEYPTGESMRVQSEQFRHLPSGHSRAKRLLQFRGQRRNGIIGILGRIARIAKGLRAGKKGRFPGRRGRSRGRSTSRDRRDRQGSKRKGRKRKNRSAAGDPDLLEEAAEEDPAEETMDPDYDCDFSGESVYYSS
uniref:DUF148 domain-containing protein n=1 Tax=Strongyloides papillosus TaxID=174720 RepID=A0A0N5C6G4_STREA